MELVCCMILTMILLDINVSIHVYHSLVYVVIDVVNNLLKTITWYILQVCTNAPLTCNKLLPVYDIRDCVSHTLSSGNVGRCHQTMTWHGLQVSSIETLNFDKLPSSL